MNTLRKPKLYFDTDAQPNHVTFDDGKETRRNFPWHKFSEAKWDYSEPDLLRVQMDEVVVMLRGHNLNPLFLAIESESLLRVRAQPELEDDRDREIDTFITEIRFVKSSPELFGDAPGQMEWELGK